MDPRLLKVAVRAVQGGLRHEIPERAAALAYYGVLSLLPLLVLALAGAAWALGSPQAVESRLGALSRAFIPGSEEGARQVVSTLVSTSQAFSGIGLVTLLLVGANLFGSLERVLVRIWGGPRRAWWKSRLLTLGMTLLVAVMAALSATLSLVRTLQTLSNRLLPDWLDWDWWVLAAFSVGAVFLAYLAVMRWLPTRRVPWRATLLAAALCTALFEAARLGLGFYASHLSSYDLVFGSMAGVFVLILWAYLSALITLVGAQIGAAVEEVYL